MNSRGAQQQEHRGSPAKSMNSRAQPQKELAMKPLGTLMEKKNKTKVERQNCNLEEERTSNETFGHLDRGGKTKM